jgi:DNA-binding GntR family transcriptional regulator
VRAESDETQLRFDASALEVTPLGEPDKDEDVARRRTRGEAAPTVGPLDQWEDEVRKRLCRSPGTELLSATVEHPPKAVADLLRLSEGEMTVVRRRLRSIDGQPWELVASYFPETLIKSDPRAAVLRQPRLVNVSGGVLARIGHAPRTWDDEIRSRMPTPEEAAQLNIPFGVPVIEHRRTVKDSASERVHVLVSILPGDRHVLAYRELDATR